MNYELAKQLKDAGFPQKGEGIFEGGEGTDELPDVYSPTLEELIEACGDRLMSVHRTVPARVEKSDHWGAEAYFETGPDDEPRGSQLGLGQTPTEAVAKLWLALNKK